MNYFTRTKDKRGLLTKFVLFMLLFLGSSGAWAQTYKKVTSTDQLETTGKYLIVYESGSAVSVMSDFGNDVFTSVSATKDGDNIILTETEKANTITLSGDNANGYSFILKNGKYLYNGGSGTKLQESDKDAKWTITFSGTDYKAEIIIANKGRYIVSNGSSDNLTFKIASSAGENVYLYKETTGGSEPVTPTISVTDPATKAISLPITGGNGTIKYTTNTVTGATFSATADDASWVTLNTETTGEVAYTVGQNTTGAKRTATITLSYGTAKETVSLTQATATPVITADPTSFSIPAAGNTGNKVTCTITNPIDGTNIVATSSETWVKNINVSGNNVTFDVDANDKEETRSATITLNYGTAEAVTVTVNQAAKAATVDPGMEEVPDPMVKTLTYSTTKGLFDKEETLSNGEGIPYYGAIAVNAAYADKATGAFVDMSDKVSGIIFKFDDATTSWTADDFKNHRVAGITTVSTRSALMAIEGRHENLKLYVIAYHIKDGVRSYSNLVVRNYKYVEDERKELTLKSSESPFTLELTEENKISDEQGTLFNDVKTVTISATDADGNNVDLSGLSFISRSSNRKLALSHMTLDGTAETTDNGNTTLLMDKGRRSGVITVLIATPGTTTYRPAFLKVNVSLVETGVTAMDELSDYIEYTSIADLRAAGRAYRLANPDKAASGNGPKGKFVLKFPDTNPATVVARFTNEEGKTSNTQKSIFITDNSGYGLWVSYKSGDTRANFADGTYNTEEAKKPLAAGSAFTGTIVGTFREATSNIPEISEMKESQTIGGVKVSTSITVDHSGEGVDLVGASIPVTPVADIATIHDKVYTDNTSQKNSEEAVFGYRPYLNTVITVPGVIMKRSDGQFVLAQDSKTDSNNEKLALFISTDQLPGVNLDNYNGLEGIFTGLLFKRDGGHAKLVITRQAFFRAEDVDEFILDEQDVEGHVKDVYETGALENKVTVKIHRKGWTTDTWGTICLPFDLTADEFKATFGQDITGLRQCKGTVSGNVLEFEDVADKNIKAGVPYLIKVGGTITNGTANGKITDETKDANYYATVSDANGPVKKLFTEPVPKKYRVENINTDGKDIVGTTVEFRGLYGKKTYIDGSTTTKIAGDQRYQYISTKAGQPLCYLPTGSTNSFAGLRAYLFFPEWNAEKNGAAQPTNTLLTLGLGDGTTTIGGIAADKVTDGKVFNLAGQYVGNSADGLAKGIYIRNGKKFIVK